MTREPGATLGPSYPLQVSGGVGSPGGVGSCVLGGYTLAPGVLPPHNRHRGALPLPSTDPSSLGRGAAGGAAGSRRLSALVGHPDRPASAFPSRLSLRGGFQATSLIPLSSALREAITPPGAGRETPIWMPLTWSRIIPATVEEVTPPAVPIRNVMLLRKP